MDPRFRGERYIGEQAAHGLDPADEEALTEMEARHDAERTTEPVRVIEIPIMSVTEARARLRRIREETETRIRHEEDLPPDMEV